MGGLGVKTADGEYYYHLKDHTGSERTIVDDEGTLDSANGYYPFCVEQPGCIVTVDAPVKEYTIVMANT